MKLQPGWIIETGGKHYTVEMVNDCRAYIVPLAKQTKTITDKLHDKTVTFESAGRGVSISPTSEVRRVA